MPRSDARFDATLWARLSPLLDELLELDDAAREARLAQLRGSDAALAAQLSALLGEKPSIDREGFLEGEAVPAQTTLAGRQIGAYSVERELGVGGMGTVWLGRRSDGRYAGQVAIKLPSLALMNRGGAERFAREGSVLGRLSHPHIARLLDAGVADRQPYLVLEYVDGEPIDRYCDAHALGIRARLNLFLDVLAAVAHAHTNLVLHRDLKPSNILVDTSGQVKLLDFGVAKLMADIAGAASATALTLDAGRAFTPEYAAPEQVRGDPVTTATDVYALGVLLYVLLGGRHPTALPTAAPLERLRATLETEPPTLSEIAQRTSSETAAARATTAVRLARALRGDLDNILAKALKKSPAERYPTVTALADDLQRYLSDQPVSARPDSLGYRTAKFLRRYRLAVGAASATLLALVAGIAGTGWQAWEAQRQRDRALAVSARDEAMVAFVELMLTEAARGNQPLSVRDLLARSRDLVSRRTGGSPDSDAAVLAMLGRFFETIGEPAAAEENLRLAAERAAGSPDHALRGLIDCHLAFAVSLRGRRDEAVALFAQAMPLARDDPATEADCHQAQAYVAQNHNDAVGALRHAQRALELRRESGRNRPLLEASLLGSIAYGHYLAGDALQADRFYAQSVDQFRREGAGDSAMLVTILNNWGIASFAAGDVPRAFSCYDEALQIAGRLAGASPPAYLFANRGLAHASFARYDEALADFDRARAIGAEHGSPAFVVSGLAGRALALREKGDPAGAAAALREAQGLIGTALPSDSVPGISLRTIAARIALLDGRAAEARTLYDEVIDFFDRRGMQVGPVVTALRGRAQVRAAQGELTLAAADLERALALARRLQGDKPHSAHTGLTLASLARLHALQGRTAQAQAQAQQALEHLVPMLGEAHPETQRMKQVSAAP